MGEHMKKITILICTVLILISFSILLPTNSYAICNTASFNKDLVAARLTLADGTVYSDIRLQRGSLNTQPNVNANNFKNLNLIFLVKVVEDETALETIKYSINSFVGQLYAFYGNPGVGSLTANKINIGIIPFKDVPTTGNIDTNNILKRSKAEVENELANLRTSQDQSLKDALDITLNIMLENDGSRNNELAQQIVLITDRIEDEQICIDSHTVLKDLSDNMIAMYGILYGVSPETDSNMQKLMNQVNEMTTTKIDNWNQVEGQLVGQVLEYIKQFGVNTSTLTPVGTGANSFFSSDGIVIIVDEEFIYGATLEIEYEMTASRYAYYGSGNILSCIIRDKKDKKLTFSQEQKLLTDPSRTNGDYGWVQEGEDVVTSSSGGNVKLILSTVITPEQINNEEGTAIDENKGVYENTALCSLNFDVGSSTVANYNFSSKALDVTILPPFGEKEEETRTKERNNNWLIYIGIAAFAVIIGPGAIIGMSKKKKTVSKSEKK